MKKMSLCSKLVVGGITLVLIPLLVIACFSVIKSMTALEDAARREALLIAGNLAGMVEMTLTEELKLIRELAVRGIIVETASRIAKEGQGSAPVEEERVRLAKELAFVQKEMGTQNYEGFFVTDLNGVIFSEGSDINFKGLNLAERDYIKAAKAGKVAIGKIVLSKKSGQPIVSLGAPVVSPDGQVVGMTGIVMKTDFFVGRISGTRIGETGMAFMVDDAGIILAHPQKDFIFKTNVKELQGMESIAPQILGGKPGVGEFSSQGVEKIAAHSPVPITGWNIVATQDRSEFLKPVHAIRNGIIIGGAIFLALAALAAVFFGKAVTKPIARAVEGLNEVADQLAAASGQISSASQDLADGTSQQAAAIEETSSSLEEISSMTRQNADNASQADRLVKEAAVTVANANQLMADLTASMGAISQASQDTQKIVKTIDEIAFQTNLLALNAAVEAARAGEAGAGFAVVADEVRNLALRAATAARNTAELIEGTVKRINTGSDVVAKTDKEFSSLAGRVGKSGELIGEIAAASREQSQGIAQVSQAITEIEQVIQRNTASAEESAGASSEMDAQAGRMKVIVGNLAVLIGGAALSRSTRSEQARTGAMRPDGRTPRKLSVPAITKARPDKSAAPRPSREVNPEEVIPFDDF